MNDANHHRSLPSAKRTFSLADYTVEARGGKWFYWRTARYGDKQQRKGPSPTTWTRISDSKRPSYALPALPVVALGPLVGVVTEELCEYARLKLPQVYQLRARWRSAGQRVAGCVEYLGIEHALRGDLLTKTEILFDRDARAR